MKKLNEFLEDLREEVPEYEIQEYDEGSLVDALKSEKPELQLKKVFGEAFYPKVKRWLDDKFSSISAPEDVDNLIGGEFKFKLDTYLKKDEGPEDEYNTNAETLARELLNAVDEWGKKVVKDQELPAGTKA